MNLLGQDETRDLLQKQLRKVSFQTPCLDPFYMIKQRMSIWNRVHFLLQTDERDWIYEVKGSRPEYKPPVAPARINSKLRYGRLKGVSTFRQIITRRTPRGVLLVMIEQRATQKLFDSCLSLVSNFCESFIFEHLTFRYGFLELSTEHG